MDFLSHDTVVYIKQILSLFLSAGSSADDWEQPESLLIYLCGSPLTATKLEAITSIRLDR